MQLDIDAKNKRHQDSGDLELPEWTGRLVRFIYLGFGLFLLTSSLMLLGCSSAGASTGFDWQAATDVISESRALEIIAENSSTSDEEAASILASMLVYQSGGGLLFVDFNSPLLTGRAGSSYVIYNDDGERIFNRLLNKRLPEGVPVIQLSNRESNGYPCLLINMTDQPTADEPGIAQTTLCYSGGDWAVVNTEVKPISDFR